MTRWSTFLSWSLIVLMGANIAGSAYYFIVKRQLAKTKAPMVANIGSEFPRFSGVTLKGEQWSSRDLHCLIIRVTNDSCAFCKRDKLLYATLLDASRKSSCEVIEMSPKAGEMVEDSRLGVVQLKFVNTDLGSVLFPFATPQTVILDSSWSIKWNRRGYIDMKALQQSLAVLREFDRK